MEPAAMTSDTCETTSDACYFTYESLFGDAEVYELEMDDGTPLRVLYVDGGFQSATFLGERRMCAPFAYLRTMAELALPAARKAHCEGTGVAAEDSDSDADSSAGRMLLLGGGTYSLPKHLLMGGVESAASSTFSLDVVEIDPAVVQIAREHFFLAEVEAVHGPAGTGRLRTFVQDGLEFVAACEDASYDVIMNDCFAGTVQDGPLLSVEALRDAKRCLRPEGSYLLNAVAEEDGNDDVAEIASVQARLEEVFSQVEHIAVEDEELSGSINHIFCARVS